MVQSLKQVRETNNTVERMAPFVVELVGLAGAGKTTLSRALQQRDDRVVIGPELELRKLAHIPIFVSNFFSSLPIYLQPDQQSRWFTWDELKLMVYLKEWPGILSTRATHPDRIILLDHGPVFKLATLNAFGPNRLASPDFEHWWKNVIAQWALTLDLIVWLEAPEAVLIKRINTRSQRHLVKGKSEREASEFLADYRGSYRQIMTRLMAHGGPTVLHFDTGDTAIEQSVDDIFAACESKRSVKMHSA